MITINRPYILERKVLIEKSVMNINKVKIILMNTKSAKRNIAIAISILIGVLFSSLSISFPATSFNLIYWTALQRIVFFFTTIVYSIGVFFYCKYYITSIRNLQYNQLEDKWINIDFLSSNWLKKLISIFVIYFIVLFITALMISFFNMSIDVSKMNYDDRLLIVVIVYVSTFLLCCLAQHNFLKSIIKIEEQ